MCLDIRHGQTSAIQRNEFFVQDAGAPLAFSHQLRLEITAPVPRNLQRQSALLGLERLGAGPSARVARTAAVGRMFFVALVLGQLRL